MTTTVDKYTNRDVERVRALYERGYSTVQISEMTGIPVGSLSGSNTLGRYLKRRTPGAGHRSAHLVQHGEEYRDLVRRKKDGATFHDLADRYGVSWLTVRWRYHSHYGKALRQYVWGEDCGLPKHHVQARRYMAEQGIPQPLIDSLRPESDDE